MRTTLLIGALAIVAYLSTTAQAADEKTLTLACQGTTTFTLGMKDVKREPISMGIIVDFTNHTVHGFALPPAGRADFPVKIVGMNEVTIAFHGSESKSQVETSITGSIDRVTGDVEARTQVSSSKTSDISFLRYALKCKPTQRMF
jgi:hypothetical protein